MNYKDYKSSRNLSWEVLIRENVTELPVSVSELCRSMGIAVKVCALPVDGQSTIIDGVPLIFISSDCSRQRQRFTAAHELGHILLGHVGRYELVNREPSPNDNPIEQAANVFASRLLAPACVLWGLGIKEPEDIARFCDISSQAAEFRAERMRELYARDKFLLHPLERAVYEQFKTYINR